MLKTFLLYCMYLLSNNRLLAMCVAWSSMKKHWIFGIESENLKISKLWMIPDTVSTTEKLTILYLVLKILSAWKLKIFEINFCGGAQKINIMTLGKNIWWIKEHTYGPALDLYLTWCSTDGQIHDLHYLQMALALP
jgi:hypothetical protein